MNWWFTPSSTAPCAHAVVPTCDPTQSGTDVSALPHTCRTRTLLSLQVRSCWTSPSYVVWLSVRSWSFSLQRGGGQLRALRHGAGDPVDRVGGHHSICHRCAVRKTFHVNFSAVQVIAEVVRSANSDKSMCGGVRDVRGRRAARDSVRTARAPRSWAGAEVVLDLRQKRNIILFRHLATTVPEVLIAARVLVVPGWIDGEHAVALRVLGRGGPGVLTWVKF